MRRICFHVVHMPHRQQPRRSYCQRPTQKQVDELSKLVCKRAAVVDIRPSAMELLHVVSYVRQGNFKYGHAKECLDFSAPESKALVSYVIESYFVL